MPVINTNADVITPQNSSLPSPPPPLLSTNPVSSPRVPDYIDINVGDWVLYHPYRSAPSTRWLKANFLANTIDWRQTTTASNRISVLLHPSSSAPIHTLVKVEPISPSSTEFPVPLSQCIFSLIFHSNNRDVRFQCRNEQERDRWVRSFTNLLHGIYNVQHVSHLSPLFQWSAIGSAENSFELDSLIGKGSFAEVYRGRHRHTQYPLAIKIISKYRKRAAAAGNASPKKRSPLAKGGAQSSNELGATDPMHIDEEERLLLQCRHPNIVTYFGSLHDSQNRLWIITELCEAGSILDIVQRTPKRISEGQIAAIIRSTLLGLAYLHDKSIIHHDIKCSNILMTADGKVKLADFGVSDQIDNQDANNAKRNRPSGTLLWMAPEVMNGCNGTTSSDIWSLGITAIELAQQGKPPYSNEPLSSALDKIRSSTLTPKLPEDMQWTLQFHQFVSLCLDRDPVRRLNARQLLEHDWIKDESEFQPMKDMVQYIFRSQLNEQILLVDENASVRSNLKRFQSNNNRCITKADQGNHSGSRRSPLSLDLFDEIPDVI